MLKIEDKELWYSTVFLAGDNQSVLLDVPTPHGSMPFSIKFIPGKEGGEQGGQWRTENGRVVMEFTGWSNPLGSCVRRPHKIGEIDGKTLGFQLTNHYVGGTHLVHFFLYKGGSYE